MIPGLLYRPCSSSPVHEVKTWSSERRREREKKNQKKGREEGRKIEGRKKEVKKLVSQTSFFNGFNALLYEKEPFICDFV